METYIVKITMSSDDEPCDLMDYVCDTYDFKWEYIPPEINIEL